MAKYQELLNYIPYFEDTSTIFFTWSKAKKREDGVIDLGYPMYDEGVRDFVKLVYKCGLIDSRYSENLREHTEKGRDLGQLIETADLNLLKSILTHFIRGERFCDGYWIGAIEGGIFLKTLYRLKELMGES